MRFETARVCVQRRTPRPTSLELHNLDDPSQPPQTLNLPPEFSYEVVAWPPGEVAGPLLPQIGDCLTLPGYDSPFRVVDRALHWPAPTTPEARRGEIRVDLIVEPEQAAWAASKPGRPGEQSIREEGRWLRGRVRQFDVREARVRKDAAGRPLRYVAVLFDIPGVGPLHYWLSHTWQAAAMFPGTRFEEGASGDRIDPAWASAQLARGQEFEVRVSPGWRDQLQVVEARPPADASEVQETAAANAWDESAQELTDELWGQGGGA